MAKKKTKKAKAKSKSKKKAPDGKLADWLDDQAESGRNT